MEKYYSVWVGGSEVNNEYLTKAEAKELAEYWKDEDYTDVRIRQETEITDIKLFTKLWREQNENKT